MAMLALFAGCRQNHAQRELLERELRFQEDRIYELEAELETARRELDRFCHTSPSASSKLSTDEDEVEIRPSLPKSLLAPPSANFTAPPDVALPAPTETNRPAAPPFTGPPVILPPDPTVPEGLPSRNLTPGVSPLSPPESVPVPTTTLPDDSQSGNTKPNAPLLKPMSSPKFLSPSNKPRSTTIEIPPVPAPNVEPIATLPGDTRVTSITLHKRTGGMNQDGRPGDEGVLVLIEPRNSRGEIVPGGGDLSVVLIDPAVPGEGGRYARWDFTADDAAALYRPESSGVPASLYLELPWPDTPPQHARLRMFVRMRTVDGRQLQTERDVVVSVTPPVSMGLRPGPVDSASAAMPSLRRPEVMPVAAPDISKNAETSPTLNWGRQRLPSSGEGQPAPALLPAPAASPGELLREADGPTAGPNLGPMLIPAVPR